MEQEIKKLEVVAVDKANDIVVNVFNTKFGLKIKSMADLEDLETIISYIKDTLKDNFLEEYHLGLAKKGVYNDGQIAMKIRKAYTKPSFDSKKFAEDYPDLYKQYLKETEVRESVDFKYVGDKKELL